MDEKKLIELKDNEIVLTLGKITVWTNGSGIQEATRYSTAPNGLFFANGTEVIFIPWHQINRINYQTKELEKKEEVKPIAETPLG